MNSIKKVNDDCTPLQARVFTRWVSTELKGVPDSNFTDITKDLSNGVALIELAQVLTNKKAPSKWEHQPTTNVQNVKNCKLAFKMFRNDGFKAIGITSKDISENNEKKIIDLVWQLINHYSIENSFGNLNNKINVSEANIKNQLLSWAIKRTQNYKRVFAFKPYDLAMCALLDSYYPSKINYYVLDLKDHQKNFKLIMDVMNELGIPCIIYPDDIPKNANQVDRKILLAQLAFLRMELEVKPHLKEKRRANSRIQRKFDSTLAKHDTPAKIAQRKANKKLEVEQDRLLRSQILSQRVKSGLAAMKVRPTMLTSQQLKTKSKIPAKKGHGQISIEKQVAKDFEEDKEEYNERKEEEKAEQIKEEKAEEPVEKEIAEDFNENQESYNERKQEDAERPKELTEEQKQVENEIVEDFNEDKEAYNERKQEEKVDQIKTEKIEEPIEAEIAKDFNENKEAYKERRQEEKEIKEKSHHLTIEKQDIEEQIDEEFRINEEEYEERKKENEAEAEKLEAEEDQNDGIEHKIDRRPQFINVV